MKILEFDELCAVCAHEFDAKCYAIGNTIVDKSIFIKGMESSSTKQKRALISAALRALQLKR